MIVSAAAMPEPHETAPLHADDFIDVVVGGERPRRHLRGLVDAYEIPSDARPNFSAWVLNDREIQYAAAHGPERKTAIPLPESQWFGKTVWLRLPHVSFMEPATLRPANTDPVEWDPHAYVRWRDAGAQVRWRDAGTRMQWSAPAAPRASAMGTLLRWLAGR